MNAATGGLSVGGGGGAAAPTVIVFDPLTDPLDAMTFTEPAVTAVTTPLEATVATAVLLVDQLTAAPEITPPVESYTVAVADIVLPAFTRADAAVFFDPSPRLRAQANVENLLDSSDYLFSNGNNNITPGSPFAVRGTLIASY